MDHGEHISHLNELIAQARDEKARLEGALQVLSARRLRIVELCKELGVNPSLKDVQETLTSTSEELDRLLAESDKLLRQDNKQEKGT